ncbi:hypothetical protein J4Q44_G00165820 [Coregonus suidteri]|uniref:Secreted protein n=1 Tax=Coregonus suidteri TaxID=861788 RepID=A0AAN8QR73_9TELE
MPWSSLMVCVVPLPRWRCASCLGTALRPEPGVNTPIPQPPRENKKEMKKKESPSIGIVSPYLPGRYIWMESGG